MEQRINDFEEASLKDLAAQRANVALIRLTAQSGIRAWSVIQPTAEAMRGAALVHQVMLEELLRQEPSNIRRRRIELDGHVRLHTHELHRAVLRDMDH